MAYPIPPITNQFLPDHAGRGRGGYQPVLLVMHIQAGLGNPWGWFNSLGSSGANAADCTIWNPRADNASLVRFLNDTDTAWTNGSWTAPNMANPVIADLVRRGVYSGDVSLTIEHEGVEGQGFTAAQIERTAQICAYWCSTYGIPADRTHIVGHYEVGPHKACPGVLFPFDQLVGRVQALLAGAAPAPAPAADPNVITLNGFQLGHGMLDYWNKFNLPGLAHPLGLPISNEHDYTDPTGKKYVVQAFERAVLGYNSEEPNPDYRVQGLLIGHEWLANHPSQ